MPVCTTLVVPLSTLGILKRPQIRELCVDNTNKGGHIWDKHIAVNANLSGLKLLHVLDLRGMPSVAFIEILGSLPALESLIIGTRYYRSSFVDCLEAFVPMDVPGLHQSSWEGQISGVLCPRLQTLQIEDINLTEQAEMMPVLKDVVTLRAAIGFPLKSFTFYFHNFLKGGQKWELIGRDKNFMMEEAVPAKRFSLDI